MFHLNQGRSIGEELASDIILLSGSLISGSFLLGSRLAQALVACKGLSGGGCRLVELFDEGAAAARLGLLVAEAELLELGGGLLADGLGSGQLGCLRRDRLCLGDELELLGDEGLLILEQTLM